MSCSPKGVSRLSLDQSLTVAYWYLFAGTGMCTFTNVCQNMLTFVIFLVICFVQKQRIHGHEMTQRSLFSLEHVYAVCSVAFHLLIYQTFFAFLVSAMAWGVVYSYSVPEILNIAFLMIFRDFLVSGVVIATLLW